MWKEFLVAFDEIKRENIFVSLFFGLFVVKIFPKVPFSSKLNLQNKRKNLMEAWEFYIERLFLFLASQFFFFLKFPLLSLKIQVYIRFPFTISPDSRQKGKQQKSASRANSLGVNNFLLENKGSSRETLWNKRKFSFPLRAPTSSPSLQRTISITSSARWCQRVWFRRSKKLVKFRYRFEKRNKLSLVPLVLMGREF